MRQKIEDLDARIDGYILVMALIPIFVYSLHVSQSYFGGTPESWWRTGILVLITAAIVGLVGRRLLHLMGERKLAALGLDGELATAEELNQLMLDGCRVFHDVPIRYGNVDHVVVSPSGVYAVNTKMLGKRAKTGGNAEVTVDHRSNVIQFPDRQYRIPVDKLTTEANCLSQELTGAVGRKVEVEPMLALPGWCVSERIGHGRVFVFNPVRPVKFFVQPNRRCLEAEMIQRLAHQLEQKCRNLEPVFQETKRWEDKS